MLIYKACWGRVESILRNQEKPESHSIKTSMGVKDLNPQNRRSTGLAFDGTLKIPPVVMQRFPTLNGA